MNNDGLRVLMLGYSTIQKRDGAYDAKDEKNLTLLSLIGFLDPPKESAGPAIEALHNQGVRVCVITGGNEIASRRTCREIGFEIQGLLEGNQVDATADSML